MIFQAGRLLIMDHHDWNHGFSVIHHGTLSIVWELGECTRLEKRVIQGDFVILRSLHGDQPSNCSSHRLIRSYAHQKNIHRHLV